MAPPFLAPGHIVDEENDMPRLLVHQHVKDLEHRFRQEFRLPCGFEGAESKERVEALAEAEIDEGLLDIRW